MGRVDAGVGGRPKQVGCGASGAGAPALTPGPDRPGPRAALPHAWPRRGAWCGSGRLRRRAHDARAAARPRAPGARACAGGARVRWRSWRFSRGEPGNRVRAAALRALPRRERRRAPCRPAGRSCARSSPRGCGPGTTSCAAGRRRARASRCARSCTTRACRRAAWGRSATWACPWRCRCRRPRRPSPCCRRAPHAPSQQGAADRAPCMRARARTVQGSRGAALGSTASCGASVVEPWLVGNKG